MWDLVYHDFSVFYTIHVLYRYSFCPLIRISSPDISASLELLRQRLGKLTIRNDEILQSFKFDHIDTEPYLLWGLQGIKLGHIW